MITACRYEDMIILTYRPLERGLLAGALKKAAERSRRGKPSLPIRDPMFKERVSAYEAFCEKRGVDPADVALAWVLSTPVVTCPIVGPRTQEQLEDSVRALNLKLKPEDLAELDTIFPGPGGEAPEAYAW